MVARAWDAAGRGLAGLLSLLLVAGVLGLALPGSARADSAPMDPTDPVTPTTVSADPLPTVQINGVAWSQVVVGNTVYVAGKFTSARPAGARAGTQETVRNNLLAYDVRTGELVTSFAPDLNAQARVVTASPDGRRIYVGGDFTRADGQVRNRIAAYDTATGALVAEFRPSVSGQVRALAATNSTVYLGGSITAVGTTSRSRLAAVSAATGALLPWAPVPGVGPTSGNRLPNNPQQNQKTSSNVMAMVLTGGGSQVVVAGQFDSLNGVKATGVGALDAASGATRPFAINRLITNQGINSAVYSLSTDGDTVYGTGYDYYGPGNLEGAFAARADGGAVRWIADCRGDTYSSAPVGGALYLASHAHQCINIGGFPEQNPQVFKFATAVSLAAAGRVGPVTQANGNFTGQPAPALLPWYPTFTAGTVTGQYQAGWSVGGNAQYVTYAGEFPRVNGRAQQGLVRFAVPAIAPNDVGPTVSGSVSVSSIAPGTLRVGWQGSTDLDNATLTYRVYRDDAAAPVATFSRTTRWWQPGPLAWTDRGVPAGSHTYRVTVSDPHGNEQLIGSGTASSDGTATPRPYADAVHTDGAIHHWSLGERTGTVSRDLAGVSDSVSTGGVWRGMGGAVRGDADASTWFDGRSGFFSTQTAEPGLHTFTAEAWFETRSTAGGKILGFGDQKTGLSNSHDRQIWLDPQGRVHGAVWRGTGYELATTRSYNDGRFHHVVLTVGPTGMSLYVDGQLVGARADTIMAQDITGYWRIGADRTWSGSAYFNGRIDEVAIYPTVLTPEQVARHHALGATGTAPNSAPSATFVATTAGLTATVDATATTDRDGTVTGHAWDFGDGTTGTGPTATHHYSSPGTYTVTLRATDDDGAVGTSTRQVTVTAPPANEPPRAVVATSTAGLTVSVDGSGSSDADGSVAGFAWEFGDGSTGTGSSASHTYAAAGTYTVRLTVTDDDGATATAERSVTVAAPAPDPGTGEPVVPVAVDGFDRTVASGFGSAPTGGPWSASGGPRSVSEGAGHLQVTAAGGSSAVWLGQVSVTDVAVQTELSLQAAPTGAGTYVYLVGRRTAGGHYRAVVRFLADGTVRLGLSRVVANAETTLRTVVLPGTYTPGTPLQVQFDVSGSGTAALKARAWVAGTAEPAAWQVEATDATTALQGPGAVGVTAYVSGSATAVPVRVDLGSFWAGPAGTAPRVD